MRFENFPDVGEYLEIIQRKTRKGGYKNVHLPIFGQGSIHKKKILVIYPTEATAAVG